MKNFILFFMVSFSCLSQQLIEPPVKILNPIPDLESQQFGTAISISGNYAVIGLGYGTSAYIYEKTVANTWILKQELTVAGLIENDRFGSTVSIENNTIVIGANGKDDPGRPGTGYEGTFYIFERNNNNVWEMKQQFFRNSYPANIQSTSFGKSVAINGNYIIVGGTEDIVSVYVKNSTGSWEFLQNLQPHTTAIKAGNPIAIDNDVIAIVGESGVILYKKSGNLWVMETTLSLSGADSLAINGDDLMVGVPGGSSGGGSVHFYKRISVGNWQINGTFSSNTTSDRYFGDAVALSDSYALTNAYGNYLDIGFFASVHFFAKNNTGGWEYIQRNSPSDNIGLEDINGVAITENFAFIGSTSEDSVYVFDIDPGDPVCTDVSIPDTVFEQWLVDNNKDSDGLVNGNISSCDAEKVTEIVVNSFLGITDLTGIEAFTNLEILNIPENDLVTLNLSNNTKLISLICYYNLLEQINITNCNRLLSLNLSENFLTSLDISGINDLQGLNAISNTNLSCIKVKDLAEATAKSSGRRPKWRVDNRSTIFNLNCPASKTSIINSSKKNLRNSKNRSKNIIVFPTHIANREKLTVLAEGDQYFDVSIYDLQGNLLKKSKKISTKVDLDISKFSPGMYIVKVNRGRNEFSKKIIVTK